MVEKFEVGKSYKYRSWPSDKWVKILYVGQYRAFFLASDGTECTLHNADVHLYDEYHEPKVEKVTNTIYRYKNGAPFLANNEFTCPAEMLGKIEITIIDNKVDSVRVLK